MNLFVRTFLLLLIVGLQTESAQAHIILEPKEAPAGSYAKLTFPVPHGCSGSPTVELTVEIPEGVVAVKPQVHPGWQIETVKQKHAPVLLHGETITESVRKVIWRGELSDEFSDEFSLRVKLPEKSGAELYFPTTQICKKGTVSWNEIPKGHDHAAFPSPKLKLTAMTSSEHHH